MSFKRKAADRKGSLSDFAMGIIIMAFTGHNDSWVFREWAPNATAIFITGIFTGWKEKKGFMMKRINPIR